MKSKTHLLLMLLMPVIGLGCGQDRSGLDAAAEIPQRSTEVPANKLKGSERTEQTGTTDSDASSSTAQANLEPGDTAAATAPPVINFPQLDDTRPLDLIDMELGFPESLKQLEGRRVSLVGFMAPFDNLQSMRRCMIVPSYVGCTFCSPPSLTQVVYVTQGSNEAPERPYPFIEQASQVTGTLRLSLPGSVHEGQQQGFLYSIENAVVTAHTGPAPKRAAGHGGPVAGKSAHPQKATLVAPVETTVLIQEVADLLGRTPAHPIKIKAVSTKDFGDLVRNRLEATFPEASRVARTRAFALLGMLRQDADWIDILANQQLARRVAAADETGMRIHVLETVPDDHPYVRLELVGEIVDALMQQSLLRKQAVSGYANEQEPFEANDDTRRAHQALRQGIRSITIRRYARSRGISRATRSPIEFVPQTEVPVESPSFVLWQSVPSAVGPFFVESLIGATGPLSDTDRVLDRPPATTMEVFRPRWYQDRARWQPDPVPSNFADDLMETPPLHTDVLGVGGLIPWLSQWHFGYGPKSFAGGWAGDRWAVWQLSDGASALLLETRWQDEKAALRFREAIPENPLWRFAPHREGSTRAQLLRADSPEALDRLAAAVASEGLRDAPP
ncbi:MAG TPA: hypothetical protein DCY79_14850 [Planctomycetaceae bacterium]|nr:hypothetical protein [Blastopirellula sp.]HAY81082.1 hypothetical protein [Planctomycetaceae bacterium]